MSTIRTLEDKLAKQSKSVAFAPNQNQASSSEQDEQAHKQIALLTRTVGEKDEIIREASQERTQLEQANAQLGAKVAEMQKVSASNENSN